MPDLRKTVGVAVDLAGCPNRCRHCYLGIGPNRRLSPDVLREVAAAFWNWTRPGEDEPYFQQVYVSSDYREPDFSDDYRQLYELERELSRSEPRRYELLSIWRLARDPDYAEWAREVGPRVCQISFFGLEEVNDCFYRRTGAFRDCLKATERLLDAEMIPRWQIFLTKPGMADLDGLMDLIADLRLRERVAELGTEFPLFCHIPGPDGEGRDLEDVRIERSDVVRIAKPLMEATEKHFGQPVDWITEKALTQRVFEGQVIEPYIPEEAWFFVNADLEVFTNYGGEVSDLWRLGNFRRDSLDLMFEKFENDCAPGLWATFHISDWELAERFSKGDDQRLYCPGDIKSLWTYRYAEENT